MDIKYEWDLTSLYQDFDDPEFRKDVDEIILKFREAEEKLEWICKEEKDPVQALKGIVEAVCEWKIAFDKPCSYIDLRYIMDSGDEIAIKEEKNFSELVSACDINVLYDYLECYMHRISGLELDSILKQDKLLWQNRNFLKKKKYETAIKAKDEDIQVWETMGKKLSGKSLNDYIDIPCIVLGDRKISPYRLHVEEYKIPYEKKGELLKTVCKSIADYLIQSKKAEIFYAKMYGFHDLLEVVLWEECMRTDTFSDLRKIFSEKEELFDKYKLAMEKIEEYIIKNHAFESGRKANKLSPDEEVRNTMRNVADKFNKMYPEFADFMWNIARKGWIDFYGRGEKRIGSSAEGDCMCISGTGESRISIHGLHDCLNGFQETISHEAAHAYTNFLGKEKKLVDSGSACLSEVFSMYTELVVQRSNRHQEKNVCTELFEKFGYHAKIDMEMSLPTRIFGYMDEIDFEAELYELINSGKSVDEGMISNLYSERLNIPKDRKYLWLFDRQLFKYEYSVIKYFVAQLLALCLDRKIRKQGDVFHSEDIELWGEIPELTVEEFVERLTGKKSTKDTWEEMLEESLFLPIKNLIDMAECLQNE